MVQLNGTLPPEPFMKMAAKEVLTLRKKVAELEEENKTLAEENDILLTKRLSKKESEDLKSQVASLKAQLKEAGFEKRLDKMRKNAKSLLTHTTVVAKRYVEALSKNEPPKLRYLLELAYFAGRCDEMPNFDKFYNSIRDEAEQ